MMNTPYLGSKISLISRAEIRYEGILYQIDQNASTVALANVKSYGTENRPTDKPVAAQDKIYQFIIFRGQDIKDLSVSSPPNPYAVEDDPAIVQTSDIQLKNNEENRGDEMGQQVGNRQPMMSRQPPGLNNSAYMPVQPPPSQPPYMLQDDENIGGSYATRPQVSDEFFNHGNFQRYGDYIPEQGGNIRKETTMFQQPRQSKDQRSLYSQFKYENNEKILNEDDQYHQHSRFDQHAADRKGLEDVRRMNELSLNIEGERLQHTRSSGLSSKVESNVVDSRDSRQPDSRFPNYSTHNDNSNSDLRHSQDLTHEEEFIQQESRYNLGSNDRYQQERNAPIVDRKYNNNTQSHAAKLRSQMYPPPQRPPYKGNRLDVPRLAGNERIPPLMPDGWQYDEMRMQHSMRPQRHPHYNEGRGNGNWRGENHLYQREFDFERSNAKFSKEDIENEIRQKLKLSDATPKTTNSDAEKPLDTESLSEENIFYDKSKSFFDKISCNALDKEKCGQVGWKDEKRMNAETFGFTSYDRRPNRVGASGGGGNNMQRGQNRTYNNRPQGNWNQPRIQRYVRPNAEIATGFTNDRRPRPQHINSR